MPRTPFALLTVTLGAVVGAVETRGVVRAVLVLVALISALPALCLGGMMSLVSLLPVHVGKGGSDVAMRQAQARVRRAAATTLTVVSAASVLWYATSPGLASYSVGLAATIPAVVLAIVWIGRRTPARSRWPLAIALAPLGSIGYLVFGGSRWWGYGQLSVLPLVVLWIARGVRTRTAGPIDPWYGGMRDGPWGPP